MKHGSCNLEGVEKKVVHSEDEGYLLKYFKPGITALPYQEQLKEIEVKKKYFGKYIPETLLCKDESCEAGYYIKQKYISGTVLKDVDIQTIPQKTLHDLLDLLYSYVTYCKEENKFLDVLGYQSELKNKGKWERRFRTFLKIYKNFLNSTNIVIADDGAVFMVDICTSSNKISPYIHIRNFCSKPFINQTLKKLKKLSEGNKIELKENLKNTKRTGK